MRIFYVVMVTAVLSAALTKFYWPTLKIETHEIESTQKDVVTIIKEIVRPDGTKETSTVTTDKSKENKEIQITAKALSTWLVSLSAARSFSHDEQLYGLSAQKRVLGPLWFGASVTSDKSIGILATMEF